MGNNNELDNELLISMFNVIRNTEIKNIKIQKYDDKEMATILADYILKKVREGMKDNEN